MRVLITGATGLIGSKVTDLCHEKGIEVNYLTTSKEKIEKKPGYKGFYWNPEEEQIDEKALQDVDAIINLVGASIAQRWTKNNKAEIINSRTKTAELLYKTLKNSTHKVTNLISASGVGVYPSSLQKLYFEDEQAVDPSFVGKVVKKWEEAVNKFEDIGIDVAKIRIGPVLAKNGGMLEKIRKPIKFYVGAPLGSGKQWQSWIHIDDVAGIFVHAFQSNLAGVYNAVAPNPVTNEGLVKQVSRQMNKPIWLPAIPAPALKAGLGEMSHLILSSQLASSNKIESTGYHFKYKNLPKALDDLIEEK